MHYAHDDSQETQCNKKKIIKKNHLRDQTKKPHKIIHKISDVIVEPLKGISNQSLVTGTSQILKVTSYVPISKNKS